MNADDRARMRDALRAAVRQARLPGAELTHPGPFQRPEEPEYDLVERFRSELTALGGTVHEARSTMEVAAILQDILGPESRGVMTWDDAHLPAPGLLPVLEQAGVRIIRQASEQVDRTRGRDELAAAAVGLTGADAGLAETGSLVVVSGPGKGRLASLLPPIHVALLLRSRIVRSLPDLLAARPDLVSSGANFVCITGPSRTADIEHVLARGVHGPGHVHVVLVDENIQGPEPPAPEPDAAAVAAPPSQPVQGSEAEWDDPGFGREIRPLPGRKADEPI